MVVARNPRSAFQRNSGLMSREDTGFGQNHLNIENLIQVLEEKSFHDSPFAVVALNSKGDVQVHASGPVKEYLDEKSFTSPFEEALMLSLRHTCAISSPSSPENLSALGKVQSLHLIEDGSAQLPHTSSQIASRRLLRTARQRSRSALIRERSSHASPYHMLEGESEAAFVVEEHDPDVKQRNIMKSFRIDSKADVTAYLESRLKRLQQLAGKKIAKAWIKGICPKKQARFPYQNKRRLAVTGERTRIPGWWPKEGVCPFTEPDHIRREERMQLCLHLLRLRPTPQQLRTWNDDGTEHNKTHVTSGWTAFLKELAGPELFDDLPREAPNRVQLRQTLLAQMYAVAAMEEQFEKDEIDGCEVYCCSEDEEEETKPTRSKRSRMLSVSSSVEEHSRRSSISAGGGGPRVKRARRDSDHYLDNVDSGFEADAEVADPDSKAGQERSLWWAANNNMAHMETAIPVAPVISLNDVPPAASALQSRWISVQPYPQHIQAPTTSSGEAAPTLSDPPTSMVSRKRALKAQRQLQMSQFSSSLSSVPVKQELEPLVPQPQDQMQSWNSKIGPHWSNTVSPFCSTRRSPNDMARTYSNPSTTASGSSNYGFQHYPSSSMASSPLVMPGVQLYPAESLPEQNPCLQPTCCEQLDNATTFTAIPMSSGDFSLSTGLESCNLNMQQSGVFDSWQHQVYPQRHIQQHDGVSGYCYPGHEASASWSC